MSSRRLVRRALILDEDDEDDVVYSFKVLLPNSTSVPLTVTNPEPEMPMGSFVDLVKEEYEKARKSCLLMTKRTRIDWNLGGKFHLESDGERMKGMVRFAAFKPYLCHIIRLDVSFFSHLFCYNVIQLLIQSLTKLRFVPELVLSSCFLMFSVSTFESGRFWCMFQHV